MSYHSCLLLIGAINVITTDSMFPLVVAHEYRTVTKQLLYIGLNLCSFGSFSTVKQPLSMKTVDTVKDEKKERNVV